VVEELFPAFVSVVAEGDVAEVVVPGFYGLFNGGKEEYLPILFIYFFFF
jgi:hypothetical protein